MTPPVEPTPRVTLVFLDPRDPQFQTVRAVVIGRPGAWQLIDPNGAALDRAGLAPRDAGDHENGAA